MDIIELLADADSGLLVSEISQRLKRRMSELFRIIIVMERRGWLRKDPETSRYSVPPTMSSGSRIAARPRKPCHQWPRQ